MDTENKENNSDNVGDVKHRVFDNNAKKIKKTGFYIFGIFFFTLIFYFLFLSPPANFPEGIIFKIEQGNTLRNVSSRLKNEQIIRSRLVFEALVIFLGGDKKIVSTNYYFEYELPVWQITKRILKGENHIAPIVVTIPEGYDNLQIADTFVSKLPNFKKDKFLLEAKNLQGRLFPDTYLFLITDNEMDVINIMYKNFQKKFSRLNQEFISFIKKEDDVIKMASIIERESKGEEDREMISGILWKRINLNMPLQVDADPETYKTKGLSKTPISNPGLSSIKAALHPKNSAYLYYLHDKKGGIHYAKNFIEHLNNIKKYLR